jgi:tetratricopeptide (TPR) repeat protein/V8-like Glu-specific endopeptidase
MKTWLALGGIVAPLVIVLPAVASSSAEVAKVAKAVTVLIKTGSEQGSGAIINRTGNTYTVLTAAHVVKKTDRKYTIELNDGQIYPVSSFKLAPNGNLDLAVVQFKSDRSYSTIKIGNSNSAEEGTTAYVAGFPFATAAITQSIYTFSDGKITANSSKPFANGYSIVYSCNTLPGMSGGPVLNDKGELIAVHGKGDNQERIKQSEVNSSVWVKTGFNLGIPVNTFIQIASTMGVTLNNDIPRIAAQPRKTPADDFFVSATNQFLQGNYPGAIISLNQAIAAKPGYGAAYIARAEANLYLNNDEVTIQDANTALKYNPNSDDAYALRGAGKVGRSDIQGALADFSKAIALNPRSARSYLYRGYAELQYADPQQAFRSISQALKINPSINDGYSIRAAAKFRLGDRAGSEADLNRALQINPNSFLAYSYRGFIRAISGNKEAGIADLDKSIAISPQNPLGYLAKGQAYAVLKEYPKAIQQLNQALKIKPNFDNAYATRGLIYIGQKKYRQGLADVEKALKFNPNNELAYQGRSAYNIANNQLESALSDIQNAIRINPSSPDSYLIQGGVYIGLKNNPQARLSLQKAVIFYDKQGVNSEDSKIAKQLLGLLSIVK